MVIIRLMPGANANAVLARLAAAGFRLQTRSTINPSLVEGYMPLAAAQRVANVAGVHSIHAEHRPVKRAGKVQSQAVALEKADIAQKHGFDGTGIKIGALSDSFDDCPTCITHAKQDEASGDLPKAVTVLQDINESFENQGPGTDEGRAMLQLVHDIAPGAALGFASAFNGELQFAENILALRTEFGADVIVDDVGYSDEPMYSDGLLSQAINIVSQDGAAYFSSAGNNGLEAFEDTYRPISFAKAQTLVAKGQSNVQLDQIPEAIRPKTIHTFKNEDGSTSITQRLTIAAPDFLDFQWDEPFNLGLVKTDFNIYIFDKDGNWLDPNTAQTVAYTTDNNLQTDQPLEQADLEPFPTDVIGGANVSDYQVVIGNVNGGPAKHIKYVIDNGLGVSQRQNAPSTFGHPNATGALGVAATYYAIPKFPEDFSSPGPVTIYFDTAGRRLRAPEIRFSPQITAADGVDTTFFGGSDPDGTGFQNFFGTSAAAPDAAAVGALVLQAAGGSGSMKPAQLYKRLEQTTTPIPLANIRWIAGTIAGPLAFAINADWTRWDRDFSVEVGGSIGRHSIRSITFDVAPIGLTFNTNLNRFSVGDSNGIAPDDLIWSVSTDATKGTITPARPLSGGDAFDFGVSVFAPIEGSVQEDPDRFRGAKVTVVLDNGQKFTSTITAEPKEAINNFTGFGLVNAEAATRNHGGK
ncbi:MAG TPA: S8 family serine peptidase [Steroidobacteraceae bacterium]|jgi:hypothetical protein